MAENRVFIIAEAGVNHNGKIALALKLIDKAKEAGANAVKFQTFRAEDFVVPSAKLAKYQKKNMGSEKQQLAMLKKLELGFADFLKLKKYCDAKKIIFLSTPHTETAIDFLKPLVPCYKIGSGDLTNIPFLQKIAQKKKPIILSTGMAFLSEIKEAVGAIKKQGNKKIILLHCTTAYPCPPKEVNLKAMVCLKKQFNLPVGLSDHTLSITAPIMAVALGAQVIEKHFTLARTLAGPDHKASLEPPELKQMVRSIRDAEKILGNGIKKPTKSENQIKKIVRKSIVAKKNIAKGVVITKDILGIKRPGTGIEPKYFNKVLGKKAKTNINKDTLINFKDIQK